METPTIARHAHPCKSSDRAHRLQVLRESQVDLQIVLRDLGTEIASRLDEARTVIGQLRAVRRELGLWHLADCVEALDREVDA